MNRLACLSLLVVMAACTAQKQARAPGPASDARMSPTESQGPGSPAASNDSADSSNSGESSDGDAEDDAAKARRAAAATSHATVTAGVDLSNVPADGTYAMVHGKPFAVEMSIEYHPKSKDWQFQVTGDPDLNIVFHAKGPLTQQKFARALGDSSDFFRTGDGDAAPGDDEAIPSAFRVELTSVKLNDPDSNTAGVCSGRFAVFFKTQQKPVWAAGTFKDASCVRWK